MLLRDLIVGLIVMTTFAGVGYVIRYIYAKKSPRNAFVGWFVWGYSVAAMLAWGINYIINITLVRGSMYTGFAVLFALTFGIIAGNIIGGIIWHYLPKSDDDQQ